MAGRSPKGARAFDSVRISCGRGDAPKPHPETGEGVITMTILRLLVVVLLLVVVAIIMLAE